MLRYFTRFTLHASIGMLVCTVLSAQTELSQPSNSQTFAWNLVIALIVIIFTMASAALPIAAMRQWKNAWSTAAKVPLFVLAIWISVIIVGKLQSADSHNLWSFELFAWAMMNMVYMVTIMTIKRIIEKNVDPSTTKRN